MEENPAAATPQSATFRCGYAAIVGRPNVGKSTLLNRIIGQKLSITADKPQTTRHQILGVKTLANAQIMYVDTPGIHGDSNRAINRYMNKAAASVLRDVDVVLFVIQAPKWTDADEAVLEKLRQLSAPVILVVNKVDQIKDKSRLLPYLQQVATKHDYCNVIPLSAKKGDNLEALERAVLERLPLHPPMFPEDQLTDRSVRFLVAELIREKLVRELGQELPYRTTVEIESFKEEEGLTRISAIILVEAKGQKAIIIGRGGERLKSIGTHARQDIEKLLGNKVFLQLWVKVKEGWSDDARALQSLGYHEP